MNGTRIHYCCDMCSRIRHITFEKLPDVPEVRKVILPPDWQWIEEGLYCEVCKKKVKRVEE